MCYTEPMTPTEIAQMLAREDIADLGLANAQFILLCLRSTERTESDRIFADGYASEILLASA